MSKDLIKPLNTNYSITFEVKPDLSKGESEKEAEIITKKLLEKLSNTDLNNIENDKNIIENKENDENIMTLEEAIIKFIEMKKLKEKVKFSTIKGYNASFKYLFRFIDKETKINKITSKFFKEIQYHFLRLPNTYWSKKEYYEEKLSVILLNDYSPKTLNTKTINIHMYNYKSLFDFLHYEEYLNYNPYNTKPLQEEDSKKVEYSGEDLKKIFIEVESEDIKNICKFSLYSGLRIGEILQLKKEDINSNLIYLKEYEEENLTLKNSNSIREVPVHKNLLKIIHKQKEENKTDFLFYDGNKGKHTKEINKQLNLIIEDKKKTFHSFRKNFVQKLYGYKPTIDRNIIKIIIGHSTNQDITFKDYNLKKVDDKDLIKAVNIVKYNFEDDLKNLNNKNDLDFF